MGGLASSRIVINTLNDRNASLRDQVESLQRELLDAKLNRVGVEMDKEMYRIMGLKDELERKARAARVMRENTAAPNGVTPSGS
jgi:hypothetical protein